MLSRTYAIFLAAACSTAVAQINTPAIECTDSSLISSTKPDQFRQLILACGQSERAIQALFKLNSMQLKEVPLLKFRKKTVSEYEKAISNSFAVFFATAETYPSEESLINLRDLVKELNSQRAVIVKVQIIGTVDLYEAGSALGEMTAIGRANVIAKFFEQAGVAVNQIDRKVRLKAENHLDHSLERTALVKIFTVPASN